MEKIIFTDPENQEDLELYLLEQTFDAIARVFEEMLEDVGIEK